jgi:hypothetical protein
VAALLGRDRTGEEWAERARGRAVGRKWERGCEVSTVSLRMGARPRGTRTCEVGNSESRQRLAFALLDKALDHNNAEA